MASQNNKVSSLSNLLCTIVRNPYVSHANSTIVDQDTLQLVLKGILKEWILLLNATQTFPLLQEQILRRACTRVYGSMPI